QDNGSSTETIALLGASPAVDAGDNPDGLTEDQRGEARTIGAGTDIGAVEVLDAIVVDTLEDSVDGDFTEGDRSLREALLSVADGGTITFANSISDGSIILNGSELVIDRAVTIDGTTQNITLDANGGSRVVRIDDGNFSNAIAVSLSDLTFTGGSTNGTGGGILNRESLVLSNSTITGNSTESGGGGLSNDFQATADISASTFSNNTAGFDGGGIANGYGATLNLTSSTVSGNTAGSDGGGIESEGATTTLSNSTVFGNSAGDEWGGIINAYSQTTLTNTTLAGNTASTAGGGFFNSAYLVTGTYSNSAIITSTIVANNTAPAGADIATPNATGITLTVTNSLVESADGNGLVNGTDNNIVGLDPLFDVNGLQNNGGSTETLALLPTSAAIDAGSNPDGLAQDQTGADRTLGAGTDIGAVEGAVDTPLEIVVDTL
ncbi:MAG: choice-of-anchor Q domain-containing protein, partial [Cyanobacteria bacterium J06648_11]